jgi:hypothetical protein
MKRVLKLYMIGLAFFGFEKSTASAFNDDQEVEANSIALQRPFSLPINMATPAGTLTLVITNRPDEADNYYLRPYSLPDPGDFFEMSHMAFIREVKQYYVDLETQRGLLIAELARTSLLPPSLQGKYVDEMLEKKKLPKNVLQELNEAPDKNSMAEQNSIFPLELQTYKYQMTDKYAFPYSVITLDWSFEPGKVVKNVKNTRDFVSREDLYVFLNNTFVDHINDLAGKIYDEMNRKSKRAL